MCAASKRQQAKEHALLLQTQQHGRLGFWELALKEKPQMLALRPSSCLQCSSCLVLSEAPGATYTTR